MPDKVAFFEVENWEKEYLKNKLPNLELLFFKEILEEKFLESIKDCSIISPFIYSQISKNFLIKLPQLKLITTRSTGFDHIDLVACQKQGITVCNVPYYGENTVAEHTFALILALSRKIIPSVMRAKKGDFSLEGLRGFDLKEKTLGVIGTGHIGIHVMRIAQGFAMKVIAYDIFPDQKLAEKLDFEYVLLPELLKNSDIITLHTPYNKETHHLINQGNIKQLKKGVIIINTARGGLIETTALAKAVESGIVSAAGLDVLEEELLIKEESQLLSQYFPKNSLMVALENRILLDNENVIITPHNAFNSQEALERILSTTVENIKACLAKAPINLVKLK